MKDRFYVITFPSTHYALQFERFIKESGYKGRLIPVPREISSSCGLAAKFEEDDLETIKNLIKNNGLEYEALYFIDRASRKKSTKFDLS